MPLLVHGITRADDGGAAPGLPVEGQEHSDAVVHGPLAAAVSTVPEGEVLPSRAELRRHMRVLESLGASRTVLPMCFGVVVPDERTLREEFLATEGPRLLDTLDRLDGHVEFRLRASYDEPSVIAEILAGDRVAARLRGRSDHASKMELGERIAAGIEARRSPDAQHTIEALVPPASDATLGDIGQPLDAFTVSLLVSDDNREPFDEAVERLSARAQPTLRFELVGPIPPFSFVSEAGAPWA